MAQVEGLTARQPVLMVVEDAQWRVVLNINLIRLFYGIATELKILVEP